MNGKGRCGVIAWHTKVPFEVHVHELKVGLANVVLCFSPVQFRWRSTGTSFL